MHKFYHNKMLKATIKKSWTALFFLQAYYLQNEQFVIITSKAKHYVIST